MSGNTLKGFSEINELAFEDTNLDKIIQNAQEKKENDRNSRCKENEKNNEKRSERYKKGTDNKNTHSLRNTNERPVQYFSPNNKQIRTSRVVGIFVIAVIVFVTMMKIASNHSTSYNASNSNTYSPTAEQETRPYKKPPAHTNKDYRFTKAELRWIVRRELFIDTIRPLVKTRKACREFNKLVKDFNRRAIGRYYSSDYNLVESEIQMDKQEITLQAISMVEQWNGTNRRNRRRRTTSDISGPPIYFSDDNYEDNNDGWEVADEDDSSEEEENFEY